MSIVILATMLCTSLLALQKMNFVSQSKSLSTPFNNSMSFRKKRKSSGVQLLGEKSRSHMTLDLAPFGRWTLLNKAAQRR